MGCVTGFLAKLFLVGFNALVAFTGVAVLSMGAIVSSQLNKFGDQIPPDPYVVLDGLQSVAGFIICLGCFGVLTVCCCQNKLFMYSYAGLGACLVVVTLVFAGMGADGINSDKYSNDIQKRMNNSMYSYNFDVYGTEETNLDNIYKENECCGVKGYNDWPTNKLANGCCKDWDGTASDDCKTPPFLNPSDTVYVDGCYDVLVKDIDELALATVNLGIFFGIFLLALIASTLVCVNCTDALPI